MPYEPAVIAQWLGTRLAEDATLNALGFNDTNVFRGEADQGAETPYIIFSLASGGADVNTAKARHKSRPLYFVRVVSDENQSYGDLDAVLNRLEELLSNATGMVGNVSIRCKGESPNEYPETGADGTKYRHQGRLWRLYVSDN